MSSTRAQLEFMSLAGNNLTDDAALALLVACGAMSPPTEEHEAEKSRGLGSMRMLGRMGSGSKRMPLGNKSDKDKEKEKGADEPKKEAWVADGATALNEELPSAGAGPAMPNRK